MPLVIRVREGEQAKELARLVRAKAPVLCCSGCGQRDFALLEQPDFGYRTLLNRQKISADPDDRQFWNDDSSSLRQALVSLLCTNCGHVEQFSQAIVEGVDPRVYGEDVIGE